MISLTRNYYCSVSATSRMMKHSKKLITNKNNNSTSISNNNNNNHKECCQFISYCSKQQKHQQPQQTLLLASAPTTNYLSNHNLNISYRFFNSENDYHPIADETLDIIQEYIDTQLENTDDIEEYEASISSGVLTISFPPHGIWVINKQTPNQQIWWSSPLSGPKRFEYDMNLKIWICSKDSSIQLGQILANEMKIIYPFLNESQLHV